MTKTSSNDDLRDQFENWCTDDLMPSEFSSGYLFQRDSDGDYEFDWIAHRWTAFLAGRRMQAEEDARIAEAIGDDIPAPKHVGAMKVATTIRANIEKMKESD